MKRERVSEGQNKEGVSKRMRNVTKVQTKIQRKDKKKERAKQQKKWVGPS